ncbi:MAG: hypothetical protein ABIA11_01745 [Patescibacteria group bacterium]
MQEPMIWGEPEASYIRRFLDGVDRVVTDEMQSGRSLLEESLTFVLARLLDGQSTFQRILDYPIEKLNVDLDACGSGTQMSIEFETNEHKKSFESAVSHADLGIVVRRESSIFGPSYTKAIIVQSKKLYPSKDTYSLRSAYEAFDPAQFQELKKVASEYSWDGVCYFLYNPKLDAFSEDEAKIVRALEARMFSGSGLSGFPFLWHPEMEYFIHSFGRRYPVRFSAHVPGALLPDQLREERDKQLSSRPGLRVLGISSVSSIVESNKTIRKTFRLNDCYSYALSSHWFGNSGAVPFLPLSSFIVDLVLGCSRGSSDENIVNIAEGKEPHPQPESSNEETPGVAVRHTLKITVRNTLPQMDMRFHE